MLGKGVVINNVIEILKYLTNEGMQIFSSNII